MKTALGVIACFLILVCSCAGESPIDQDITLVGRDQAALAALAPVSFASISFPALDLKRHPSTFLAPADPPIGDWLGNDEGGLAADPLDLSELISAIGTGMARERAGPSMARQRAGPSMARERAGNGALSCWT